MKRAVIFAHYDKDSIIDDYVIFYLKELKKNIEKVIFVSCNELNDFEKQKLNNIADNIISEVHNEYDFGSYKRGFEILKAEGLSNYEEIIFANDSCYGPMFPLYNVFEHMEEKDCDFWGITKNYYGLKGKNPHMQSYFFALRKNAFISNEFISFLSNIQEQNNKNSIVENYEIGLSKMLYQNGFKDGVYIDKFKNIANPTIKKWKELILKYKMPFLKCSILRLRNCDYTTADGWQEVIKETNYPAELIEQNLKRTSETFNNEINLPTKAKEFIYNSLNYIPKNLRLCIISSLRKVFSTVSQK